MSTVSKMSWLALFSIRANIVSKNQGGVQKVTEQSYRLLLIEAASQDRGSVDL